MNKFWNWVRNSDESRTLYLNGTIAEESWFDDDITPAAFKAELLAGEGDITVWINSPGGDCVAASQIYSMLMDYKGAVTVKIDGIAASAASVIARAGTTVLMAPTSLMMVHNPLTVAIGDTEEMQKAIAMLDEVKESIINAYEIKTGLSRARLSALTPHGCGNMAVCPQSRGTWLCGRPPVHREGRSRSRTGELCVLAASGDKPAAEQAAPYENRTETTCRAAVSAA